MTGVRGVMAALCLVLAGAAPARAQGGGIEIGMLASYLTAEKGAPREMGRVPTGGVFLEAPLFATIRIHPSVHYQQRRSKAMLGVGAAATLTDVRIDYISVPILVRMPMFGRLYVTEGATFHFPIKATFTRPGEQPQDVLANLSAPDISMVIGVGMKFGIVGLEGRWDSGFLTVQETQPPGEFPNRNRAISALLVLGL
jgi:hypothetical protein